MSEQPNNPMNDAAAPDISEGERIRRKLVEKIESGVDLRDRDQRIRAKHEVEHELSVPYGNIGKQVRAALSIAAKNAGEKPLSFKKESGGAEVEVKTPRRRTAEDEPPTGTDPAKQGEPTEQAAPKAKPKLSDIYEQHGGNPDELKKTIEYQWMRECFETGIGMVESTYRQFGILEEKQTLIPDDKKEMQIHMSVLMCMKYDWHIDERIEKIIFIAGWALMIFMPPLAKLGLLQSLKDKLTKSKPDDKRSKEPLTETKAKV